MHPILQTNRILWAAILFSSLLLLVALVLVDRGAQEPREPVMLPVLASLAW